MNEPTAKKILFNKSMLISLKAELLRKQEEVIEKKQLPQNKIENFKPPKSISNDKGNEKSTKRSFKDNLNSVDAEELEANRKVRSALEKKAELYEHLADASGTSELAGRFLVDFNVKKQNEDFERKPQGNEEQGQNEEETYLENGSEWVEFTDCLGRTRKCHYTDLDLYKKRDKELMKGLGTDGANNEKTLAENENKPEMPFLVQKTNDYLQSLREKWEEKERELVGKDRDIHYQDLLFDEARIHGVGYYSFSTDEAERRKQMDELMKRRQETLKAQEEAEQLRKKRDDLMKARVAAARARQRARAGLPPEEPKEENQKDFTTCLLEFLTQQKNEADEKAKEEERKAKEEAEKERQKLREAHIREWDLGKEGVDEKVKKFRTMTQEEYVEQQRSKRIKEFAPVEASSSSKSDLTFDDSGRMLGHANVPVTKTWADVRPRAKTPPPPAIGSLNDDDKQKGLYFSSKKHMKYKNFVSASEPVPIQNEVDEEEEVEQKKPEKRKLPSNHAEIEPPPTYDYYGPTRKYIKPQKPFESDMLEAYAQGSKSLENKHSDKKVSKQYDFTFD